MDLTTGVLLFGWIFVLIWIPLIVLSKRKIHPKALFVLFFAELWERFSFYGMRALLILYMTKVLFDHMSQGEADEKAYGIYGAYGALVYGMPVLGGLIADRVFGFKKSILFGGILMMFGHFVLALEGLIFEGNLMVFFLSLALIIVGNGYFKPNISSFLGEFYEKADVRKDGAFTIFYMGVNIGAFLAPLTCGYLGETKGWHYGFGAAGIGMLIGIIVFSLNKNYFGEKGNPPVDKPKTIFGLPSDLTVFVFSLLLIPLAAFLLNINETMKVILLILTAGILGYLAYTALQAKDKSTGQRLLVVVVLFFFHTIFWALFEQAGGSLTLFAERNVNRLGIPTSIFQSVNPLFIMLLAPVFSWVWVKLNQRNREPSTPMKFVLGLVQLGLGFLVIVLAAKFFNFEGKIPVVFLVLMYMLHTMGELCLSPVGLSMVTKLSPAKVVGFVMGAWFLSISLAHEVAVSIGKLTAAEEGQEFTTAESLQSFASTYLTWGVFVVFGAAFILLLLVPTLKKWMHGIH